MGAVVIKQAALLFATLISVLARPINGLPPASESINKG
jgi:hypothetical protein